MEYINNTICLLLWESLICGSFKWKRSKFFFFFFSFSWKFLWNECIICQKKPALLTRHTRPSCLADGKHSLWYNARSCRESACKDAFTKEEATSGFFLRTLMVWNKKVRYYFWLHYCALVWYGANLCSWSHIKAVPLVNGDKERGHFPILREATNRKWWIALGWGCLFIYMSCNRDLITFLSYIPYF